MPLVANSKLPTFERLRLEGETVGAREAALRQDIRELHIGLPDLMPDGRRRAATPATRALPRAPFWKPLIKVIDWADENGASTLCSCLATHAVLQFRYGQKRKHMGFKRWGVYAHRVVDRKHPLLNDVNTRVDVPHSP